MGCTVVLTLEKYFYGQQQQQNMYLLVAAIANRRLLKLIVKNLINDYRLTPGHRFTFVK